MQYNRNFSGSNFQVEALVLYSAWAQGTFSLEITLTSSHFSASMLSNIPNCGIVMPLWVPQNWFSIEEMNSILGVWHLPPHCKSSLLFSKLQILHTRMCLKKEVGHWLGVNFGIFPLIKCRLQWMVDGVKLAAESMPGGSVWNSFRRCGEYERNKLYS